MNNYTANCCSCGRSLVVQFEETRRFHLRCPEHLGCEGASSDPVRLRSSEVERQLWDRMNALECAQDASAETEAELRHLYVVLARLMADMYCEPFITNNRLNKLRQARTLFWKARECWLPLRGDGTADSKLRYIESELRDLNRLLESYKPEN